MSNCLQCGEPIPWRAGRAVRARAKFCSNACKFAHQRSHPPRPKIERLRAPCDTCGIDVAYLPSQRKKSSDAIYCSRKCKGVGHSILMTGRRYVGEYTSRTTYRALARTRFLDRCAICGWDEGPNDVAHIIARKHGGQDADENVVMLCPNHHRLFDRGSIAIETVIAARPNCVPG